MIQPNELRIGNWVNGTSDFKKYPMPLKVQAITNSRVYYHINNEINELEFDKYGECNLHCNDVYPVELTPDILEAAGFRVNKDNSFGYINENEGILIELGDFDEEFGRRVFYYVLPDTDDYTCIAYCKHLHQLQNLYYCLTGEELQIDINKINNNERH